MKKENDNQIKRLHNDLTLLCDCYNPIIESTESYVLLINNIHFLHISGQDHQKHTIFIALSTNLSRIIEPIKSRFTNIRLDTSQFKKTLLKYCRIARRYVCAASAFPAVELSEDS